ncbi:MAG: pantetheine-phosphate adenylyltransferase [Candidatus Bathyarchaeia archaeon]
MVNKFRRIAVGGTFDSLHKGHRKLLEEAFLKGEEVIIGLTTDRLARELHTTHTVASYEARKEALLNLLRRKGVASRAHIIPIDSREGTAADTLDLEAIVVSPESYPGALRINELRRQRLMKELEIIVVEEVMAEDGKPISATRIRAGEIDREGKTLSPQ